MSAKLVLAATVLATLHSFVNAEDASSTITAAPVRRTDDLALRAVSETTSPLPLTDYTFPFSQIPYQVNPFAVGRGPQSGYNECNSTTEGASSQCQTLIVNSLVRTFASFSSPLEHVS